MLEYKKITEWGQTDIVTHTTNILNKVSASSSLLSTQL